MVGIVPFSHRAISMVGSVFSSDLAVTLQIVEKEGPARGLHLNRPNPSSTSLRRPTPLATPLFWYPRYQGRLHPLGMPHCPLALLLGGSVEKNGQIEGMFIQAFWYGGFSDGSFSPPFLFLPPQDGVFTLHLSSKLHPSDYSCLRRHCAGTLTDLSDGPLSEWSWLKASLPSSHWGLNIRRAALHPQLSTLDPWYSPVDWSPLNVPPFSRSVPREHTSIFGG